MPENAEEKLNVLVGRVAKVRRWLVTIAILKVAALCLIFVSVFTGLYAWLDHRLNFNETAHIIAFIMLLAGFAFLLHRLIKLLINHISYSAAANYIENRNSLNQQLVTAMEYYENRQDYPYSKALAEQLVLRVDKESREFKFDSTIEKWQGYALGAIIVFGLAAVMFYVRDNYIYFSSYFARLTNPLTSVEPLSTTYLASITKDIVAEPDSEVKFVAEIDGRVPETGKLVLIELKQKTAADSPQQERQEIQVRPQSGQGETPQFRTTKSFSQPGKFKYRFETDSAKGDWHELNISHAPDIESIAAKVSIPRKISKGKWIKPYIEQIENNTLQVIQGSSVTLSVKVTDKLSKMTVTGPDGKAITRQLNGAEELDFYFTAEKNGSVKFSLVNQQGLFNDDVPDLQVIVKNDEPAKFKLVSPDGDYLATNVASVPVTFEVTDDFGLKSVTMHLEIAGRKTVEMEIPVEEGAKKQEFTHTVELEEYELSVGDSVLFYAEAADIDTGSEPANHSSSSEVYFIEIRPYRQNWVPMPGGGPSQGANSPPVELLNILEYTRAILKKTWAIASKPELTDEGRSRLGFINQDIEYCVEQVVLIRDDSQYGFEEPYKAVLNEVIRYFKQASRFLDAYDAASAMNPEKGAYRVLRKFILELELAWSPPSSGNSPQAKKPDSVKLQEKPEFTGYEKERIEGQLKKMQQKLDKLTRDQGQLKWSFENFLEQQAEKKTVQQNLDARPAKTHNEEQDQKASNATQKTARAGKPAHPAASDAKAQGGGQDGNAGAEARLRMLQAKQHSLQEQVLQLKQELQQLPQNSNSGKGRAQVQGHLGEASARMEDFQNEMAEARYRAEMGKQSSNNALALMESARRELDLAKDALDGELTLSNEEKLAQKSQEMAEQLAEDADALDESVSPLERKDMLARLEAAKRLLEMMPEPQWSNISKSGQKQTGASLVFTRNPNLAPAEAARQMARRFWSIAIDAKKRRQRLIDDEPSDMEFYGQEKEFFENAAMYDQKPVQK